MNLPDQRVPQPSTSEGTSATGIPAQGAMDQGKLEPLGNPVLHHWKQASITDPSLDNRGSVFFAAVEMTRTPMILADPRQDDCPIAFANNAFLDLTGYEESEVLGRNCRFLQGVGTDPDMVQQLRKAIDQQRAISLEILNYRRDGTPFWNAIFMGPVFDYDGTLIYFFASQLDVTARRESEQSMRQAQKIEAIGQLTAGLAHDFNNLLQVLDGSLERLHNKRHDDVAFERHLITATMATERGAKLTRQLLAFARRTHLDPKGVDLSALILSFAELLEASAGNKAELHLNLQRRLPQIRIDASHLQMALLNIVVNARDASPGGGAITIATKGVHLNGDAAAHHLEPGDYVMLTVTDEGIGMPPHVVLRATEPFFTTKEIGQGTGLGLAMAHGFVQQSGGRLEIDSTPEQGTTIRIYFPKMAAEAGVGQNVSRSSGYQPDAVVSIPFTPRILVVDDNTEIANLAAETLSDIGYHIVVAHNGTEALEQFDKASEIGEPFSLVFSDVLMPGGANGLVLAEQVQARMPSIPVILTTGYNDEMSIDAPRPISREVLGKPYKRSQLIDRVQAALREGARTGPGRQISDFGHVRE